MIGHKLGEFGFTRLFKSHSEIGNRLWLKRKKFNNYKEVKASVK